MGRPRKPDRMTRLVQTRVTDEQYDWLFERAIDDYRGELSAAVRSAIDDAQMFARVLNSRDPLAELGAMIARGRDEDAREASEDT